MLTIRLTWLLVFASITLTISLDAPAILARSRVCFCAMFLSDLKVSTHCRIIFCPLCFVTAPYHPV